MPRSQEQSATYFVAPSQNNSGRMLARLLPGLELALCALLGGLLLWKGILPGWRFLNSDFPNYYLVARLLHQGYALDRIYDWVWLQRIKDHWGLDQPLVGFAGLTPFSALPIVPFSIFSALVAKRLWLIANLLFLGSSVELLKRVTSLSRRRLWLLSLLAVFPLRTSFLLGQMHLLVLLLFAMAYFFHRRGKDAVCAVCLSVAGFMKVYPLLFLLYFLWRRQWRSALAMLCAVALLLGVGYAWIGSDAINIYLTQILPRSVQGEVLDPYSVQAASVAALFHKLFIFEPSLNPTPLLQAPWLYAALYPLWQVIILVPLLALLPDGDDDPDADQVGWAAYLLALLVLSPVPASYHFVVIILSMILFVDHLSVKRRFGTAGVAVALYCAISMIELVPPGKRISGGVLLAFGRLWIELLLLAVFFLFLWQRRTRRTVAVSHLRIASLCVVAVILWTTGALGYRKHFKYLPRDLAGRIAPAAPAYLSTGVRDSSQGYLFTVMSAAGYRVLDQNGQALCNSTTGNPPADQLSAARSQNAPAVLIELAGKTGSSLVAVTGHCPNAGTAEQFFLPDAESPALSSGGTSVAFIREAKGRGTLWLAHLEQPLGRLRGAPVALTDQHLDVRDVTFAHSGWLLFTAKADGHTRIFSMAPASIPRIFLSPAGDVDSPAISADERGVAFRQLIHSRWQLGYMDVATGDTRQLTFGDCNAYSPAWVAPATIVYATDCGRGLGLSALAYLKFDQGLLATAAGSIAPQGVHQ